MAGLGVYQTEDSPLPDSAKASAEILERFAKLLRANGNREDLARELLPIVRSWMGLV